MNAVLEATEKEEQLVAFRLANEIYGVDISVIHEIIRLHEITQIPRTSPDIEGVVNLRGRIVPILDLRKRLELPAAERTGGTRIIVVTIRECTVGMVVDSVIGVVKLPESRIEPPSPLVSDLETDFIRGVGKMDDNLVILLNIQKVLRAEME